MKTRKLNKKGEVNWYLIAFILSVAVLVLMFWGPLGSWWKQLSDKYDFFQKSVDARLQDLELFGPSGFKQEDLNYIAQKGSLDEIKKTLEVYKKEIENKCIEDTGFKSYVERVENSAIGTDVSSDPEKWNEYLNFMKFVCNRLYSCLNDPAKTDKSILDNFVYFAQNCQSDPRVSTYVDRVKMGIKKEYPTDSSEFCNKISRYPVADSLNDLCLIKNIEASCPSAIRFHVKININLLANLDKVIITLMNKEYPVSCLDKICKFDRVPEAFITPPKTYDYKIKATLDTQTDTREGHVTCS